MYISVRERRGEVSPSDRLRLQSVFETLNLRSGNKIHHAVVIMDNKLESHAESHTGSAVGRGYDPLAPGTVKIWMHPVHAFSIKDSKYFKPDWLMPSFWNNQLLYTVAHELGHCFDTGKLSYLNYRVLRSKANRYAQRSAKELWAEAWADFYCSEGKSENIATRELAKGFNWRINI